MCCCATPTINGQPGYRWQPNDTPSTRPANPPALADNDRLLFDEPGRCGGQDSHCHHYCVVVNTGDRVELLVRHGGGEERIRLSNGKAVVGALAALDSNGRYWLLNALYHAQNAAARMARENEHMRWTGAALDKRIKVNRRGRRHTVEITEKRP
jgi:hypothetical protein